MWCYKQKRIDILKPKLPVTHPHPEEFKTQIRFEFQSAKIHFLFLRKQESKKKIFNRVQLLDF